MRSCARSDCMSKWKPNVLLKIIIKIDFKENDNKKKAICSKIHKTKQSTNEIIVTMLQKTKRNYMKPKIITAIIAFFLSLFMRLNARKLKLKVEKNGCQIGHWHTSLSIDFGVDLSEFDEIFMKWDLRRIEFWIFQLSSMTGNWSPVQPQC